METKKITEMMKNNALKINGTQKFNNFSIYRAKKNKMNDILHSSIINCM